MSAVAVRVFHVEADPDAGPLARRLADVRRHVGDRLEATFHEAGATDVSVLAGPPDDTPFGARIRALVGAERPDGLVVAGSGSLPLARPRDIAPFLSAAASGERRALANNRYSADIVAVARAATLADVPDLGADNALPRWLGEVAGYTVADRRLQWRLQVDIDGPIDALLAGVAWPDHAETAGASAALAAVAAVAHDRRAELLVAGRSSAATARWLERCVPGRVRLLVEERGLRAASREARSDGGMNRRPPRSVLGLLVDRDGPAALGGILASLADAAIVDSRVLLAHRFGPDERSWPALEDRLASDLLLADRISDPWLRALTASAVEAPIPVVLGGHTLVGPGLPLALGGEL